MTELSEAVSAATASNTPQLIAKYIDPLVVQYVKRLSPLLAVVPSKKISTNQYYFNQETVRPDGGAVVDGGARATSWSTFVQGSNIVRNYQAVGQVTKFAQAVTAGVVGDLYRQQVDSAMKNLTWAVETGLLFGNDVATAAGQYPGMQGLDYQCSAYSGANQNAIDFNAAFTTLSTGNPLDQLIDLLEVQARELGAGDLAFVMSTTMASKIAQLSVPNQRFVNDVDVAPGLNVFTYRDIPILKSSFLASRSTAMGTLSPSTSTTGGTLAATTYYYRVSAIINRFGESAAATEVSQTTTGATSTVTLTFATPTGPDANGPILYKVWRSTAAGTETLLGVVDAYDKGGTAVTAIIDTGTGLLTNSAGQTDASVSGQYVGQNAGQKPRAAGQEDIFLIPRNEDFLVRPYVRDFFAEDLAATITAPDMRPFYVQSDTCLSVRDPKFVGRISRVSASL